MTTKRPSKNQVEDVLDRVHEDLEANVLGIEGRRDLMFLLDLSYHSVLAFDFQGRRVRKGVVEVLVVGDTRTGKSHTARAIVEHYGVGDFLQGEATSIAGLLGGVDEGGRGNRYVRCGRLPYNHRGLVVIDEANELTEDAIGVMSGVRSEGFFDLIKIVSMRIPCRVRLVWIANPRSKHPMASYPYGCEVIPEVIGKSEDIARFDAATIIAHRDVNSAALYQESRSLPHVDHRMTSKVCQEIVLWCWSRKPSQVVISEETERAILNTSRNLSGKLNGNPPKYSDGIPLVIETEQRNKIARMSVSLSGRLFMHDGQRNRIVVWPEVVEVLEDRLDRVFSATSMGYDRWSKEAGREQIGPQADVVFRVLGEDGMRALFNSRGSASRGVFQTILGDRDAANVVMQKLMFAGGIENAGRGLKLSGAMVERLRTAMSSGQYGKNVDLTYVRGGEKKAAAESQVEVEEAYDDAAGLFE